MRTSFVASLTTSSKVVPTTTYTRRNDETTNHTRF